MSEAAVTAQRCCPQCGGIVDTDARFCKHCAFDLSSPLQNSAATVEPPKGRSSSNSKLLFLIGGVAVIAVGILILGILGAYILTRNRTQPTTATASPASAPTMSDRAKQVEGKILRGDTLSESDIAGLSAYELRVLRNVHFARYGRKYDTPGLGEYFNTCPWYKPSDDYKDSMISSTDKANINLILAAENIAKDKESASTMSSNTPVTTPSSSQSSSSSTTSSSSCSSGALTTACAQRTMDRWSSNFGGKVTVIGVQEIPSQNVAQADLQLTNFTFKGGCGQENVTGRGAAGFSHYTDGRWVLTLVRIDGRCDYYSWKPSIEVQ